LSAANAVIANNAGRRAKKLWTDRGAGEKLTGFVADSETEEASWVVERIDELRGRKDAAVTSGDFDTAAGLREELRRAGAEFQDALRKWKETHAEETIEITGQDIAETVSFISGVPVEKMNASTAEKLLTMEKNLGASVIGQEEAIKSIARALRRSRALTADPKRPIGSFLFLGPTGVGKTHLAKMLADKVYGDDKALISLDMSEFQEKYSSSRLVGAPPGYVGYDEGGQLTEKVRRRPYSVVLFDEFEKANGDVMNMLLQILDEGRLTDGQGRVVDFRNTIIICTANLGFDFAREGHSLGFAQNTAETSYEMLREKLMSEARRTFRPELLNRFDDIVVFRKLEKADMKSILELELAKLQERLQDSHIALSLDAKAVDFLVEKGYDSALGARPLRRVVQQYIEDPLADAVLSGKVKPRMRGRLDKDGKSIRF
jgi:ATP-dependent Clp protease ATP-binding subunit ClpC